MIRTLNLFLSPQPVSQPPQQADPSVKKPVSSKPLTEEKIEQIYQLSVAEIMKVKGVTKEVAEAEVNHLW